MKTESIVSNGNIAAERDQDSLVRAIKDHPFFHGIAAAHLGTISYGASEAVFEPGQLLLAEGKPANQFYLIRSGKIALEVHEPSSGTVLVQTLTAGDVLGWSWLFPPFAWHLRAQAIESSRVIVLNAAHLLVSAEHNPVFGYELMKRVAAILIQRLQAAAKLLAQQQLAPPVEA
jgi:CRP-like cAMP-binding protein